MIDIVSGSNDSCVEHAAGGRIPFVSKVAPDKGWSPVQASSTLYQKCTYALHREEPLLRE